MSYKPIYTITPVLLAQVEQIAGLRERILAAAVQVPWIPALQKDTRIRNAHSSTAIEGNPLTLEQVRAIEEGREIPATAQRARREVANYFAGLRFVEKNAQRSAVTHAEMLKLHRIMAGEVMDQGRAGRYRTIRVRVGSHVAPPPEQVQPMMSELLQWWNIHAARISPIVSSAIVHHQFETIHPFADGNGRTGRMLSLWELYRRGFDSHHIFSIDEFYWEDRPRYYAAFEKVRKESNDLSSWLEVQRRGIADDAGASLDPDSKADGTFWKDEARASTEAGAVTSSPARREGADAARNLGWNRRVETRRARFVATAD